MKLLLLFQPDLIKSLGYPVEEHSVQSQDGYIVTMHRIPHGLNNSNEDSNYYESSDNESHHHDNNYTQENDEPPENPAYEDQFEQENDNIPVMYPKKSYFFPRGQCPNKLNKRLLLDYQ